MRKRTALEQYVNKHLEDVEGWAGTPASLLRHADLLDIQDDCDGYGAFEIGVHHGRYLIALHNACAPGTKSVGVDLFADQARNVSVSGSGDLAKARASVDRYAREPDLVELISGDSLAMSEAAVDDLRDRHGPFRIVSVDGGHHPIHAATDIRLAARVCAPGGFISVDDFFHVGYPGVTEGVYASLAGLDTPYTPLVLTRKKLFLAHMSYRDSYLARAREVLADDRPKDISIGGYPCLSVLL